MATGDAEGTVRLWDVATGALRHRMRTAGGFVFSIAFHAGLVVTAHRDGVVRLWDATTGAPAGELRAADGAVHRLVSMADTLVSAGSRRAAVRVGHRVARAPRRPRGPRRRRLRDRRPPAATPAGLR